MRQWDVSFFTRAFTNSCWPNGCLSRLHNNLFWLGARSSWPQSKQKFSNHRNFKSWRTYEKLPFWKIAGCWRRSTCPTYVPHMSRICPTYVPHVLVVVLQHTEAAAQRRFPVAEPPRFSPILQPKLHPVLLTSGLHLLNWNQKVSLGSILQGMVGPLLASCGLTQN